MKQDNQNVAHVNSVCFSTDKEYPQKVVLHAIGIVISSGWTNARLVSQTYVVQPSDATQDFDFVATPPTDRALQVLSPITSEIEIALESWVKAVRIRAVDNNVVVDLNDPTCAVYFGKLVDHTPCGPEIRVDHQTANWDGAGGQGNPNDGPHGPGNPGRPGGH